MAKKSKFDYFDAFEKQTKIACEEAEILFEVTENFKGTDALEPYLQRAHEIEHQGDMIDHDIFQSVATDFITPIDRGDILELGKRLDDIVDSIEDVIQCFYMYDIRFMHEASREFAKIIKKSTKALDRAMQDFRNFKKSKKLRELTTEVNALEEQGDRLYMLATRCLYQSPDDPIEVAVWANLFDRMERCCDACEAVADVMGTVVLKNM